MKLLVMSDSHRRKSILSDIIYANKDSDAIIFLGDGINDFEDALFENNLNFSSAAPEIVSVLGNCDAFGRDTFHLVRNFGGINFYITHGAAENVKLGLWSLIDQAKKFDCPVALYGHTHIQSAVDYNGVKCFNPGAVEKGKYGIIEIKNGEAYFYLKELFH